MKKNIIKISSVFLIFCFIAFLFLPLVPVNAQEVIDETPRLFAEAGEDKNIAVNRQMTFSALGSVVSNLDSVDYLWEFGNGYFAKGEEVSHTYVTAGVYRVKLTLTGYAEGKQLLSSDEIIVNVDREVTILISDVKLDDEKLELVKTIANTQGILVVNVQELESDIDYIAEKELAQKIIKSKDDIQQASSIIIWTDKNIGLNAFIEAAQTLGKSEDGLKGFGFANKYFVVVTEQNFSATSRVAQSLYNLLEPQFITLTSEKAVSDIFTSSNLEALLGRLRNGEIDYQLVGPHSQRNFSRLRPWNLVSFAVGFMVDRGVPLNTIYLILILPVIATIIAIFRQIVGVKALGIYAPSIIAVSFLVTGLKYGLIILLITLAVGTLGRLLARKIRLSYLPRMAIVLSLVSFVIFAIFLGAAFFEKTGLVSLTIFPILIMVLLTEKFVSVQIERGSKNAVLLTIETLVLSIICYWIANWQVSRTVVIGYPEIVLLTLFINFIIGKWTGLRLVEYYRFRKVIKNVELATKK